MSYCIKNITVGQIRKQLRHLSLFFLLVVHHHMYSGENEWLPECPDCIEDRMEDD